MSDGMGVVFSMLALFMLSIAFITGFGLSYEKTVVLMLLNMGALIADANA